MEKPKSTVRAINSPIEFSSFNEMLRSQKDYEATQKAIAKAELESGVLPTTEKVRTITSRLVGDSRLEVMSSHIYWKEMKLKEGLFALISAAHTAAVDVCKHEAAVSSLYLDPASFMKNVGATIENPVQKDIMAYGSASTGMIDCVRRITKRRPDLAMTISEIIKKAFDNDINAFMKDLRNNLAHGSVVVPGWRMDFDENGGRGSMNFNPVELLLLGTWSTGAKRYIVSEENLHLGKLVREHFKCVNRFSTAMTDLFSKNISPAEKDYYEIEDEYRRQGQRQWAKILISQIGKNKDPYAYLHRFFKPNEVRLILRLPNNSKEQVDLIISLKNSDTDCDDELRMSLYRIFGVPDKRDPT